jgi:cysteine-rich repeat protein
VLAGCLHGQGPTCADGRRCPADEVCDDVHSLCVDPAQVTACAGAAQMQACAYPGVTQGTCVDGVCFGNTCGNGMLDPGEVCDGDIGIDTTAGQACSPDCRAIYVCGNGVVDPGESCDDGNSNPDDGCDSCRIPVWAVAPVVGSPLVSSQFLLQQPSGLAIDHQGRVYVADSLHHLVERIELDNSLTIIAGTGDRGFSGDGKLAVGASLYGPGGVAVDGIGRVYIADTLNNRIRRVDLDGTIRTIAGTGGTSPPLGDGGPAVDAVLFNPQGVAVDGFGNVFVADTTNGIIRQITPDGTISTVNSGALYHPFAVAVDPAGFLLVADTFNNRVVQVAANGTVTPLVGSLSSPAGVAVDALGQVLIADTGQHLVLLRMLDGSLVTLAGTTQGFSGDGGAATAAKLDGPSAVAVDASGRIWIADQYNNRIRRIELDATIATVAGAQGLPGDGEPATAVSLSSPSGVAVDSLGRVLIADSFHNSVRRVDVDGTITTLAGGGAAGYSGDGSPATTALLSFPTGVAVDSAGRVAIADNGNNAVRRIELDGTITTVVGGLSSPGGVAIDGTGAVLATDTGHHKILRIDSAGTVTTIAGTGTPGFAGDGFAATSADIQLPRGVAVDGLGRIVIADTGNNRIRRVATDGTISTIGGDGSSTTLNHPIGVATDSSQRVVIGDSQNHRILRIELDGSFTSIAGITGSAGFAGDGGTATSAQLSGPQGVAVDGLGRILVADVTFSHVRRIDAGVITTVAGAIDPAHVGPVMHARLADPQAFVHGAGLVMSAGGLSGTLEIVRNSRVEAAAGSYPQFVATGNRARFQTSTFGAVGGVAVDASKQLIYITETTQNRIDQVVMVDPADPTTWTIAPLVNAASTAGFADGSAPTFRAPTGLLLDGTTLYIADTGNHAIRALDLQSLAVTTIVNKSGSLGFGDGPSAAALLYQPSALAKCGNGDMFIADTGNNRVRRLSAGVITTVLGDGIALSGSDGAPASARTVDSPRGVGCDASGDVFVSSSATARVLPADGSGVVDGTGGVYTIYAPGPSFPATLTRCLTGLVVIDPATVEIADACTGLLLQLRRQ